MGINVCRRDLTQSKQIDATADDVFHNTSRFRRCNVKRTNWPTNLVSDMNMGNELIRCVYVLISNWFTKLVQVDG